MNPYVKLDDDNIHNILPPPKHRNVPQYHQPQSDSDENCCIKWICCCGCCLFFLIFFLTTITYLVYAFYDPHFPWYNVEKLGVTAFDVLADFSTNAEISVTVKADNFNERISFIYGKDSAVSIMYKGKTLCAGKLPAFKQPQQNITMIKVVLKGKSKLGQRLQQSLMADKKAGKVPLLIAVKAPVTLVIGDRPLKQFLVRLKCNLVVENLAISKQIKILSSKIEFGVTVT